MRSKDGKRKKEKEKMINRKQFIQGNFETKYINSNKHPIILFLKKNKDKAFTTKEISKNLKMNLNSVRGIIRKFEKQGKVLHKIPYYIIK